MHATGRVLMDDDGVPGGAAGSVPPEVPAFRTVSRTRDRFQSSVPSPWTASELAELQAMDPVLQLSGPIFSRTQVVPLDTGRSGAVEGLSVVIETESGDRTRHGWVQAHASRYTVRRVRSSHGLWSMVSQVRGVGGAAPDASHPIWAGLPAGTDVSALEGLAPLQLQRTTWVLHDGDGSVEIECEHDSFTAANGDFHEELVILGRTDRGWRIATEALNTGRLRPMGLSTVGTPAPGGPAVLRRAGSDAPAPTDTPGPPAPGTGDIGTGDVGTGDSGAGETDMPVPPGSGADTRVPPGFEDNPPVPSVGSGETIASPAAPDRRSWLRAGGRSDRSAAAVMLEIRRSIDELTTAASGATDLNDGPTLQRLTRSAAAASMATRFSVAPGGSADWAGQFDRLHQCLLDARIAGDLASRPVGAYCPKTPGAGAEFRSASVRHLFPKLLRDRAEQEQNRVVKALADCDVEALELFVLRNSTSGLVTREGAADLLTADAIAWRQGRRRGHGRKARALGQSMRIADLFGLTADPGDRADRADPHDPADPHEVGNVHGPVGPHGARELVDVTDLERIAEEELFQDVLLRFARQSRSSCDVRYHRRLVLVGTMLDSSGRRRRKHRRRVTRSIDTFLVTRMPWPEVGAD